MGRPSRGRSREVGKLFTFMVTEAELEELHRRARAAGFTNTSEWARRRLLGDPSVPPASDGSEQSPPRGGDASG